MTWSGWVLWPVLKAKLGEGFRWLGCIAREI